MERPPGLPTRDARTPDSEERARILASPAPGMMPMEMVDMPSAEMRHRMERMIVRVLKRRRGGEKIQGVQE